VVTSRQFVCCKEGFRDEVQRDGQKKKMSELKQ